MGKKAAAAAMFVGYVGLSLIALRFLDGWTGGMISRVGAR